MTGRRGSDAARRPSLREREIAALCPKCEAFLHEETFIVEDSCADPVSRAYQRFFDDEKARTCRHCGEVMPKP